MVMDSTRKWWNRSSSQHIILDPSGAWKTFHGACRATTTAHLESSQLSLLRNHSRYTRDLDFGDANIQLADRRLVRVRWIQSMTRERWIVT